MGSGVGAGDEGFGVQASPGLRQGERIPPSSPPWAGVGCGGEEGSASPRHSSSGAGARHLSPGCSRSEPGLGWGQSWEKGTSPPAAAGPGLGLAGKGISPCRSPSARTALNRLVRGHRV